MKQEEMLTLEKEIRSQLWPQENAINLSTTSERGLSTEWEERANEVIKFAEGYLWRNCCVNIRSWLIDERGLNEDTVRKTRLGWTPQDVFMVREEWGLPPEKKDDGKDLKVWIPQGLVIPFVNDGHIQRVRVRRDSSENGDRYCLIPGSSPLPMVLGSGKYVVVVESELDGFLLDQEAGDLVRIIALGSVVIKPDPVTTSLLEKAKRILVALDGDEAGARISWEWWLKRFSQAKRWPTPSKFGKDPTEARKNGLNLRNWVLAGINSKEVSSGFQLFTNFDSGAKNDEKFEKLKSSKMLAIHIDDSKDSADEQGVIHLSAPEYPTVSFSLSHQCQSKVQIEQLKDLLESPSEKILYDAKPIVKLFNDLGLKIKGPLFDLKLAEQILTAGIQGGDLTLQSVLLEYAPGQSSDALFAVKEILATKLKESGLTEVSNLEFQCVKAVAGMESNGIFIRVEAVEKAKERFILAKIKSEQILQKWLGDINFNSQPQLTEALRGKGINASDTREATLLVFRNESPEINALLVYKKSSYLLKLAESLLAHIDPSGGRIHAHYHQIGAPTGRFSCSDPNIQSVPRYRQVRSWFSAPPGFKLVIGDYSQIELRVAAEITGDKRMIEAYRNGEDLHRLTASLISGRPIDSVTKQDRQAAKAVNFGLIYAMGAQGLCEYAREAFGMTLSEEQAVQFRQRFFEAYPGIAAWHEETQEKQPNETRTILGRRRFWNNTPKITELLNSPIQGTSADIIKKVLSMLPNALEGTRAMIVGCVHDEILLEVPIEATDEVALILKETMEEAGKSVVKTVPVEADVIIVSSWAEK